MTAGAPPPIRRPPRAAGRRILAAVLLLPVVELAVAIEVGRRIGTGPTVLVLVAISVTGLIVVSRQGKGFTRLVREAGGWPAGRDPSGIAINAAAGILLILPGFITGLVGALLFLPPVRGGLRRLAARRAAADGGRRPRAGTQRVPGVVVTGEVITSQQADAAPPAARTTDDPPAVGPSGSS